MCGASEAIPGQALLAFLRARVRLCCVFEQDSSRSRATPQNRKGIPGGMPPPRRACLIMSFPGPTARGCIASTMASRAAAGRPSNSRLPAMARSALVDWGNALRVPPLPQSQALPCGQLKAGPDDAAAPPPGPPMSFLTSGVFL